MESQIKSQLAKEMGAQVEWIANVKIDEENHTVDFECGGSYWAKLTKGNDKIRKNTIRKSI